MSKITDARNPSTLWWHATGPHMSYARGVLHISSLNPETYIKWRMSRREMWKVGWAFIRAAMTLPT